MNLKTRIGIAVIAAAVVFQLFFRYEYLGPGRSWRIDRLTATRCRMPCYAPTPAAKNPIDAIDASPTPDLSYGSPTRR